MPALAPQGWSPPDVIDEYRLVRLIGRGGMGQIYLAEDRLLERHVAVKFIASVRPDESARQRFYVEARALARLSHPNVVAVHRVGEIDGRPYLIAEFVRGRTLAEFTRSMPWERVLRIGRGLARGLAAAHRQGVLHRDIKPANVMVTEDEQVKLLDFGLAKLLGVLPEETGGKPLSNPRAAPHDQSTTDGFVGTPLYMAPEVLRGEPATRASDLYSLGAVLYELCTGVAPRQTVSRELPLEQWMAAEPAPLLQLARDVDPRLAALISRCLWLEPERRFGSAEELCGALDDLAPKQLALALPEGNPYRGLRPFEAEHRAFFFGRSAEVRTVLERLRTEPLLVVAGDSGVGKSSLCRAGVLPLVTEEGLEDGRHYRALTLVPGRHPLAALCSALGALVGVDVQRLFAEPRTLGQELGRAQARTEGTLVFIDQLEELFTLAGPDEAVRFGEVLAHLATTPGVRVLMAVRGDYFTRLAALPALGEEFPRALYLLRPLSPQTTRAAITEPARQKGFRFESEGMVEALVESAARTAGGLPLLQFAMAELWEARDEAGQRIPASALDAIGGVAGALARHANRVLEGLLPEQRRVARSILLRLVTAEGTRGRLSGVELGVEGPIPRGVLDALVRGRLLVASEVDGGTAYEVAHEALLQGWDTLRRWLDADGEQRQVRQRLEFAAAEWVRLHRVKEALWSERQLAEATRIDQGDLSPRGAEFLSTSRAQARRVRYARRALVVLAPVVVVLALVGLRLKERWDLEQQISLHEAEAEPHLKEGLDQKRAAQKNRQEAYELFDKAQGDTAEEATKRRRKAEKVWTEALKKSEAAELSLALAGKSLEAALALDSADERMRGRVGDVLAARLELAEWFHQEERRKELAQWLEFLVPTRTQWLKAPPQISIQTSPPGAEVVLERYTEEPGTWKRSAPVTLGRTPLKDVAVTEPGSYRLTLHVPGRALVYYPILLQRAERVDLHLDLPEAAILPKGFVYVPPGSFLLGSADPDGRRRGMLRTAPLHEVPTAAFLISKTEVTLRDWLQFLAEQSPADRKRLTPSARLRDWGLELEEHSEGWRLTLTLNKEPVHAAEGTPLLLRARCQPDDSAEQDEGTRLILETRCQHASQDWSQMPVAGISFKDALEYFAWLDRTGSVPGARFCDEREWERAARGADGRAFPHGDLLEPEDANFDETYGRQPHSFGPDMVGSHPESVSPFGLFDMVGNVYELTSSMWIPNEVVIRGGSWYYDSVSALAANRTMLEPNTRDMGTGLRVCADPPRAARSP